MYKSIILQQGGTYKVSPIAENIWLRRLLGQRSQLSSGKWPLVGCPCFSGWLNTCAYTGGTDWNHWFMKNGHKVGSSHINGGLLGRRNMGKMIKIYYMDVCNPPRINVKNCYDADFFLRYFLDMLYFWSQQYVLSYLLVSAT